MYKLKLQLNKLKVVLLTGFVGLLLFTQASANECRQLLPGNAIEDGMPKVCQSDFSGTKLDYVCQDFRAGEQRYQVLYRGGITPRAVLQQADTGKPQTLALSTNKATCPLAAPAGIPAHAIHRGIGLCLDQNDNTIACSVYEHATARELVRYRHMVFYKTNSKGNQDISIDTQAVDSNHEAMAAELAYQIGISLAQTECCAEQAIQYLAYAHQLFPHARIYREAYRLGLDALASLD